MRAMSSCFRSFAKALSFLDYDIGQNSASKLYVESALPGAVLDLIRIIKIKRGWTWKGEYYDFKGDTPSLEVLMYTFEGSERIIQVDEVGNVIYIYMKDAQRFYVF